MHIDRRVIYTVLLVVVLLPLVLNWKTPPGYTNPWTQAFYDRIEALPPGTPVILAVDFEPASRPELYPMAIAVTRHIMRRDLRLITMTLAPGGVLLAEQITAQVAEEQGKEYGVDYVNLGIKPNPLAVILGMGENLKRVYTQDTRGQATSTIPALRGVNSYADLGLLVELTATGLTGSWIVFAHQRYKVPLAAGVTSVVAMDLYPYLKTRQLVGMLNGIAGAAEYEKLLEEPDQASLAIPGVTAAHLLMVALVIIGNLAYVMTRRQRVRPEAEPPQPSTGEGV